MKKALKLRDLQIIELLFYGQLPNKVAGTLRLDERHRLTGTANSSRSASHCQRHLSGEPLRRRN
jgi:hypothetical protein